MKFFGEISVLANQLRSVYMNTKSWFVSIFSINYRRITNSNPLEPDPLDIDSDNIAVIIRSAGGFDKLEACTLHDGDDECNVDKPYATVGYNVPSLKSPLVSKSQLNSALAKDNEDLVIVNIKYFSINYADVCIRWGLYESAIRYVGWPICPGFDFSGVVVVPDKAGKFEVGDLVFGFTMFGAYSSRLIVPSSQIRRVPTISNMNIPIGLDVASAIPAAAATALHSIYLAGGWPTKPFSKNKAALVHSAAGGVGSMLLQILKKQGYEPIVAVVGQSHKIQTCIDNGANFVIDKSSYRHKKNMKFQNMWKEAEYYSPTGFAAIFDANGVETLQDSYDHLDRNGRLITYGFHSNLPKKGIINPLNWLHLIYGMTQMPKFDPMQLCLNSKAVLGFNLSFFAEEKQLIESYLTQIISWIQDETIKIANNASMTILDMKNVRKSHQLIQSGNSIGKILIKT